MADWSRNKVDASNLNNGQEYTIDSDVSLEQLNAVVNSGLYSQDFAEALADTPIVENSTAGGQPSVVLVDNVKNGKTYKKFKFINLGSSIDNYATDLSLTIDSSTYVVTAQLKDQKGNNIGTAQTIDLPLESVVVSGEYDSDTKEVVLTLKDGSNIRFSVADLISGLASQSSLNQTNENLSKLSSTVANIETRNNEQDETIGTLFNNKVDKVEGKGLSTNDYTTAEKTKLAGLENYDDTEVLAKIGQNSTAINTKANQSDLNTTNSNLSALTTRVSNVETKNTEQDKSISKNASDIANLGTTKADQTALDNTNQVLQGVKANVDGIREELTEYQGTKVYENGVLQESYIIDKKADVSAIPTLVSQLENDKRYITLEEGTQKFSDIKVIKVNGTEVTKEQDNSVDIIVPTKTSDLTNDNLVTKTSFNNLESTVNNLSANKADRDEVYNKVNRDELENYVTKGEVGNYATIDDIPTKTSDLTNDSGFITSSDIPTIPTKTSQLTNDSGFITANEVPDTAVLYGSTGQNTDGAMTQKATTDELNKKVEFTELEEVSITPNRLLDLIYPIGSIRFSQNLGEENFLGGIWEKVAEGRTIFGAGTLGSNTYIAGQLVEAGLPNITGSVNIPNGNNKTADQGYFAPGGAIYRNGNASNTGNASGAGAGGKIYIDASRSSAIYGNSNTVQPNGYVTYIYERKG